MTTSTSTVATFDYESRPQGEHQIFGAPGTGKSTTLSAWITRAAQAFGSSGVFVTSFTKAAATELAGKNLPIKPEQVATLHAHAYRALHKPRLIDVDKELIQQWNTTHPQYALGVGDVDTDDPYADEIPQGAGQGDEVFSKYQLMRARMQNIAAVSPVVHDFAKRWEDFKRETRSIDFTDMISLALKDVIYAPGQPTVMFVDEAQDMTKLEWSLVRKWGQHTQFLIVAGDDDQCIYAFKGASAETFFETDLPESHKHVLKQSHRVPQAVHERAMRWVAALSKRHEKIYRPRVDASGQPVVGNFRWLGNADFMRPHVLIDDAEQYVAEGKSVMFLTTCAYMLTGLKSELRERGHVFHNPYRRKRGDWNPLGKGRGIEALVAFLQPLARMNGQTLTVDNAGIKAVVSQKIFHHDELMHWVSQMAVSTFLQRGAVKELDTLQGEDEDDGLLHGITVGEYLQDAFDLIHIANGDLNWFLGHVAKQHKKKYEYLCSVVRNRGKAALIEPAQITIGTIHSVKGGEADVVYLMPDLSRRAYEQMHLNPDEIIRQFYVGMTRCRDTLVVANPATDYYVRKLHKI